MPPSTMVELKFIILRMVGRQMTTVLSHQGSINLSKSHCFKSQIRKEDFESLPNKIVKSLKRSFESKAALKRMINDRQKKLESLFKIIPYFFALLFTLFNQIKI